MYHSHTYQEEAFNLFAYFIKNALNGDNKYQELVRPILLDAHLLATKQKDYYTVDRESYAIITYLAEKDSSFFEKLSLNNIANTDYNYVLNLITEQRDMHHA